MTPQQRKAGLKKKGITQKSIAQKLKVSEMSVSRALDETIVSDKIYSAIADALGLPKEKVFPTYYLGPKRRSTSKVSGKTKLYRGASQCQSDPEN